ncbi:DNA adenine methylase [Dongia sedimenti]|uniref:Site-specific DNA-methyltransferase (adenine-specific) n=1 Tax=Dongia sedimenti TaxID=3064282 RepID=A0ABU0YUQ1_9PROT|nr:Dam family site-specific DNA-(adenine-N6)-methyltransferase [Rhodospirillaceae bacterium R-7]
MNSATGLYGATTHGPSFLRWAGSKRKSLADLASCVPTNSNYVEPFAGSAALFFSLRPQKAVLADLNGHLINAMRQVRDNPLRIHRSLARMPRDEGSYYRAREEFNGELPQGIRSAVLFIYLNRNCFNGLWRTNLRGLFNVPYGGSEMGRNPPRKLFDTCSTALKRARLRHQDFRKTIADAGEGSFIYADPPYFTATERTFIEYGRKSFGERDLEDLIDGLKGAARRGAKIALTYNAAMPLVSIPRNWSRIQFDVTRNVGGFAGARKKQAEILYTNCRAIGVSS